MVIKGKTHWVEVGYTLPMLCYVAGTWNEQGNDCVGCASGFAMAPSSDVASYSNENPSITPFFAVGYLE
jgi:hypothetical protein